MTSSEKILIKGARVYDPSQEWAGELRDLYLSGGRISEPFGDPQHTIDAGGRPLLAGGIDPHCQLAGHGHSLTRMFVGSPSPDEIGLAYARMGYVHVHQPFTTLLTAGLVRHAMGRIPFVDTSTCVSIDLRDMGQSIRGNQPAIPPPRPRPDPADGSRGSLPPLPVLASSTAALHSEEPECQEGPLLLVPA